MRKRIIQQDFFQLWAVHSAWNAKFATSVTWGPVHTAPEKFENTTITGDFWICVWGKLGQGNHMIIVTLSFSLSSVFKMFSVHTKNAKREFSNSSGLNDAFEKFRSRDRFVGTIGLTVEKKSCVFKLLRRKVDVAWNHNARFFFFLAFTN